MSIFIRKDNAAYKALVTAGTSVHVRPMSESEVRAQPPGTFILTGDKFGKFGAGPTHHGFVMVHSKPVGTITLSQSDLMRGHM